jgi:hypothetical protein
VVRVKECCVMQWMKNCDDGEGVMARGKSEFICAKTAEEYLALLGMTFVCADSAAVSCEAPIGNRWFPMDEKKREMLPAFANRTLRRRIS